MNSYLFVLLEIVGVGVRRGVGVGGSNGGDGGDFVDMSRRSTNIAKAYASTTMAQIIH